MKAKRQKHSGAFKAKVAPLRPYRRERHYQNFQKGMAYTQTR